MKPFVLAALSVLSLAFVPQASASILEADTMLTGSQQVPPVTTTGSGMAELTIDTVAETITVMETFEDLMSPTLYAHIHIAMSDGMPVDAPGHTGPVVLPFTGFPVGVTSGTYDHTFTASDLSGISFDDFVSDLEMGAGYYNIHTDDFPGGEIRGNIVLSAVPLPSSAPMLGAALIAVGAIGFAAKRRRAAVAG